MNELFHHAAVKVSRKVGSSSAFIVALVLVLAWAGGGIVWGFNDTWLLLINTTCSVTTFLIVFLIQNSQNRQSRAMQLKLDELLKAVRSARTDLVDLEDLTDQELDDLEADFRSLRREFIEKQTKLVKKKLVEKV